MNLFDQALKDRQQKDAPLAARMRPHTLDEYVGQEHIIGHGRLLRRAIQADQLGSLIFYGPPGTGKTTLAKVIANTTKAHFIEINAVLAGVAQIRESINEAQERAKMHGQRTILFVDEVHRFNKAQQDALLPWVENGTVILIGATTENPYFEVNKALVSRSRIFQLVPLTEEDLRRIVRQALADRSRGFGKLNVIIEEDALDHLVDVANGDARAVLNALELAVETTKPDTDTSGESSSAIHITLAVAEESIQHRAVLYDKEGDYHFDTISAFIKSLRGSDPDAAMYWMAKMVYAGEAPRFIFRRMLIFAGEDVGMADPNAITVVTSCAHAFEQVGMPEGRFHLATAGLYLATCKKSNTTFAFFDAIATVEKEADSGVPNHLKDGNRDKEGFGHGEGYLYPHAYQDHWVAQQYLPSSLQGKVFYQPSDQGYEAQIRVDVARRREAQLAAMLSVSDEHLEVLSNSPDDPAKDRWLQRTISNAGEKLGMIRDRVLDAARLQRHHLVLDLKAATGLITWEALRRVPEGGVYTLVRNEREGEAIKQQAEKLSEVERPLVLLGDITEIERLRDWTIESGTQAANVAIAHSLHFDALVGYNTLIDLPDKTKVIQTLPGLLNKEGVISLAERIPRHTQRLYRLVDLTPVDDNLRRRIIDAEEAIYAEMTDPLVNWDVNDLVSAFQSAGLQVTFSLEDEVSDVQITASMIGRWFAPSTTSKPSYGQRLETRLSSDEVQQMRTIFERQLLNKSVKWGGKIAFLLCKKG